MRRHHFSVGESRCASIDEFGCEPNESARTAHGEGVGSDAPVVSAIVSLPDGPRPKPARLREVLGRQDAVVREVDHDAVVGGVRVHTLVVLDRASHDRQSGCALLALA